MGERNVNCIFGQPNCDCALLSTKVTRQTIPFKYSGSVEEAAAVESMKAFGNEVVFRDDGVTINGQPIPDVKDLAKDAVNHPSHYTTHPSGVECITITEHMNFNLGNAMKYIWRAGLKGNERQDLEKAIWYINRELQRVHGKK